MSEIINDKPRVEEKQALDDRVLEASCKVDEIGAIAFCAASASFIPEKCEDYLDGVLLGIKSLCEQISNELYDIAMDLLKNKGVSV